MKILFLVPYPRNEAPSQRFRYEQYLGVLLAEGHLIRVNSFLRAPWGNIMSKEGRWIRKILAILIGAGGRMISLLRAPFFDFIFIHREAAPMGPPVIEWILAKVLRKRIIYDFDDAIWLTDRKNEGTFTAVIKWRNKVKSICRWSYKVSCGNEFLQNYALNYNKRSILNPTTIDAFGLHKRSNFVREHGADKVVIGWTGSYTTLKYLQLLEPVLKALEIRHSNVSFLVIADQAPSLGLRSVVFRKWSLETEIADLAQMDIGVMPLENDIWSQGKCGFKALQYMSMEIPAVASPVGVNNKIVIDGVNGFLCDTESAWLEKLERLIDDRELRSRLGAAARKFVEKNYSVASNLANFLSLFA